MPRNVIANPWQIGGSDSEDDANDDYGVHLASLKKPTTPLVSGIRPTPRIPDWDPIVAEEKPKGKSSSKKSTSSSEKTPPFNGPVFVKQQNGKFLSRSFSQIKDVDRSITGEAPETSTSSSRLTNNGDFDPTTMIKEDLKKFIYTTVPQNYPRFIHCCLRRDKSGIHKGFFPTYYLHAERIDDEKKFFLLAARKVGKLSGHAEYIITHTVETLSEKSGGEGFVGKLQGNDRKGIEYTLYDNGLSSHKVKKKHADNTDGLRRELVSIIYKPNLLGLHGIRHINAIIPKIGHDVQPKKGEKTMLNLWHDRRFNNLIQLRNRISEDTEGKKKFTLKFIGSYEIQPSIKNFQIVMDNENNEEEVVMQFGRIDDDSFVCDYRYPLSAIQAFSIALSSFESRLGRD